MDRRYGGSGGFQFGSTAKAFALVTAMKQGLGTHASVDAPAADNHRPATFSAKQFPPPCGVGGTWSVYNDEPWKGGSMSLRQATAQSTNTAFVALASPIGVCAIHSTMTAFGIHGGDGQPLGTYPPQVVLGAQAVSPQTMAEAYAGLADHGTLCDVHPVTSVVQGGRTLWAPPPDCRRVADPRAVDQATQYLEYNMTHGSGALNQLPGRPSAGKTGTSDGNAQSWFVGYTPPARHRGVGGQPGEPHPAHVRRVDGGEVVHVHDRRLLRGADLAPDHGRRAVGPARRADALKAYEPSRTRRAKAVERERSSSIRRSTRDVGSRPPSIAFGSRRTCCEQLKSACTSVPRLLPSRPAAPARFATHSRTSAVAKTSSHQAHIALAVRVRPDARSTNATASSSTGTTAYALWGLLRSTQPR
ncbi:hypothetical protein GCM10027039_27650 [Terrabacter koreensis]